MTSIQPFLIDADIFISGMRRHYAFDICPGFWDSLMYHHEQGRIFSVERVREELLRPNQEDDLTKWIKQAVPRGFFLEATGEEVSSYRRIVLAVEEYAV